MKIKILCLLVVPLLITSCAELTHKQTFSADKVSIKTNDLETRLINVEYSIADRSYKQNDPQPEVVGAFGNILKDIIMEVLKEYIPAGQLASATSDVVTVLKKATKISKAIPASKKISKAIPASKKNSKVVNSKVVKKVYLPFPRNTLWKPVAHNGGPLVFLISSTLTKKVDRSSCAIYSDPLLTKIIEKGKFSSVANGNREHYRFTKQGKYYPSPCYIAIKTKKGKWYGYKINVSSKRNQNY